MKPRDKILKILHKNDQISIHEMANELSVSRLAFTRSFKSFEVISEL
jgi:predicted ArsR family transcriptional regulator